MDSPVQEKIGVELFYQPLDHGLKLRIDALPGSCRGDHESIVPLNKKGRRPIWPPPFRVKEMAF